MAKSHILVLPEQELAALQAAAQTPQIAHLLRQLPAFAVALAHPLPDRLAYLAATGDDAAREAQANTSYPEDWSDFRETASGLGQARQELRELQAAALAAHAPSARAEGACPCCGGTRRFQAYSKGINWGCIAHLGFEYDGSYMPSDLGIPAPGGDGPQLEVCLDCGRIINGEFPLTDEVLKVRIAERCGEDLA